MKTARTILLSTVSALAIACSTQAAKADWQYLGQIQGVACYRDTLSGKEWTQTIGRVPSSDWGKSAQAQVQTRGFRLPSFQELQEMYNRNGGGGVLRIRNGLLDYYETSDPNILGNAFGNGFQTPQRRLGVGSNYFLGVR